jgi:hypothetical protein
MGISGCARITDLAIQSAVQNVHRQPSRAGAMAYGIGSEFMQGKHHVGGPVSGHTRRSGLG